MIYPLDVQDNSGKEITLDVSAININNIVKNGQNTVFYTDANGLNMRKRILNSKVGLPVDNFSLSASNYYPVNSAIYIEDNQNGKRLTLLNDRS